MLNMLKIQKVLCSIFYYGLKGQKLKKFAVTWVYKNKNCAFSYIRRAMLAKESLRRIKCEKKELIKCAIDGRRLGGLFAYKSETIIETLSVNCGFQVDRIA